MTLKIPEGKPAITRKNEEVPHFIEPKGSGKNATGKKVALGAGNRGTGRYGNGQERART